MRTRAVLLGIVVSWWLVAAAAAAAAAAAPAPAQSAEAAEADEQPVCLAARALTESGRPQQAIALLDATATGTECTTGRRRAVERADRGSAALARALALRTEAEAATADGDDAGARQAWRSAGRLAEAAVGQDAELDAAAGLVDESAAAVEALPDGQGPAFSASRMTALEKRWTDFVDGQLSPAAAVGAVMLAVVAALLVLSRLYVLLPISTQVTSRRWRRVLWFFGLGAAATCAWIVTVSLPGQAAEAADTRAWVLAAVAAGAVAVLCIGTALATRMRMSISAGEDEARTTRIVAHLRAMGAEPPKGVEVPLGADVEALEGTAIIKSVEGWLAPLVRLASSVTGVTPWHVTVTSHEGHSAVVMTRNGRGFKSTVLTHRPLGKTGPEVDSDKLVAAFVLTALAEAYSEHDFRGLAGATDPTSLGLLYVAQTNPQLTGNEKRQLLRRAVAFEPQNIVAQIALQHALHRTATDAEEVARYLAWLDRTGDELAQRDLPQLELRLRYTALAVAMNAAALQDACDESRPHRPVPATISRQHAEKLAEVLKVMPSDDAVARRLLSAARPLFGWLAMPELTLSTQPSFRALLRRKPEPVPFSTETVDSAFNRACTLTRPANLPDGSTGTQPDEAKMYEALQDLVLDAATRRQLVSDPFLVGIAATAGFRERCGVQPRTDPLGVPPLDQYAATLRAVGLTTPQLIVGTSDTSLAWCLGVDRAVVNHLKDQSRVLASLSTSLVVRSVEVAFALREAGAVSPSSLAELEQQPGDVARIVNEAFRRRGMPDLTVEEHEGLETWLAGLRETASSPPSS